MNDQQTYRRGDVILASIPLVTDLSQRKTRPVVVIQNDVGNRFSANLIVAVISSQIPARAYPTNLVVRRDSALGSGTGLDPDSAVQAEVIWTVPRSAVIRRLGSFTSAAMAAIDDRLRASLDL